MPGLEIDETMVRTVKRHDRSSTHRGSQWPWNSLYTSYYTSDGVSDLDGSCKAATAVEKHSQDLFTHSLL